MANRRRDQDDERYTEYDFRIHRVDTIGKIVGKVVPFVVKYVVLAFCVVQISKVLIAWTGEEIGADLKFSLKIDFPGLCLLAVMAAFAVALLMSIYGWKEARLRRRTICRFKRRIAELEKIIDPGRSSSGLSQSGDTPPEDNSYDKE